jgi:hypothetical protein
MSKFTRVYLGSVTLTDTERACEVIQRNSFARIISLKRAILLKNNNETNVNVAEFEEEDDLDNILNELTFIETTAPNPGDGSTLIFNCEIYINDVTKTVKVFGKKPA